MAVKTAPASYFRLVQRFPSVSIRDDTDLVRAQALLDELLQARADKGTELYLDALTDLVELYEREREHEPARAVSEGDVLRELMRSHGLSQQALEAKVGIAQSTISSVLNGTRSFTRGQVITLARFFGVKPGEEGHAKHCLHARARRNGGHHFFDCLGTVYRCKVHVLSLPRSRPRPPRTSTLASPRPLLSERSRNTMAAS
jgi:HTH-type transcriptional regulator / antitoxin HigA